MSDSGDDCRIGLKMLHNEKVLKRDVLLQRALSDHKRLAWESIEQLFNLRHILTQNNKFILSTVSIEHMFS